MSEEQIRDFTFPNTWRQFVTRTTGVGRQEATYDFNFEQTTDAKLYRRGYTNPHWRAQVKAGEQAGTILHAYRDRNYRKPAVMHVKYSYGGTVHYWYPTERLSTGTHCLAGIGVAGIPSSEITKADNEAKTKFISEANDARRVIQSGEMIGEFAELVRQVSNPGKSLRKGLDSYVKAAKSRTLGRKIRRLPAHKRSDVQARILKDTWLEYQFGWRPLVSEIDNAMQYHLGANPFDRYDTRRVQGVGRAEGSSWLVQPNTALTYGPPTTYGRIRGKYRIIIRYRGEMQMRPSMAGYTSEKLGLHPADWIPTIWELVPYSFLIDYFANIGDLINAASFPKSSIRWMIRTIIKEQEGEIVSNYTEWSHPTQGTPSPVILADVPLNAKRVRRTVDRAPYSGSLVPILEFSIPGSGTKWLNMTALFLGAKNVQKQLQQH